MQEILDAAERRRLYLSSEIKRSPILVIHDCEILADAYLAEHKEDEPLVKESNQTGEWITDWNEIAEHRQYIACCIGQNAAGNFYLYQPNIYAGWQVKRLMKDCYAAIPMPQFCSALFKRKNDAADTQST